MQPTSDQVYGQMNDILKRYKEYTPANINDVTTDFLGRVNNFQPQYNDLAAAQAKAYALPASMMNDYYKAYGTEAGNGPSAMSRLQSILENVGQNYGNAQSLGNIIDTQKGRIGDLANTALNQYNSTADNLMKQYQALMPVYQSKLQAEESARARAAASQKNDLSAILDEALKRMGGQTNGAQQNRPNYLLPQNPLDLRNAIETKLGTLNPTLQISRGIDLNSLLGQGLNLWK